MSGLEDPTNPPIPMRKVRMFPGKAMNRVGIRRRVHSAQLKKGIYLIPSLFTTGNLICGFFSLISTFNGQYLQAAMFIILAHVLDGLDGSAARLTHTTSQFGVEFDSLADLVSFGVAPAVLAYYWALVPWKTWGWLAACLFVLCGALRLALFNVQIRTAEKSHFVGLPIPAAAEMIAATVLMYYYWGVEGATSKQIILLLVIYALAGLMVSNFSYFSVKQLNLKRKHPLQSLWILLFAVVVIKLAIVEPQITFFMAFLLYTLSGPLLWCAALYRRQRGKRAEVAEVR